MESKKWEYFILNNMELSPNDMPFILNELGKYGWELLPNVIACRYVLKRETPEKICEEELVLEKYRVISEKNKL